ncbi:alpha/beta hydrolase family protein [Dactylosporangium sp. CA-233914]|uniref:alpha/beta hydrolase family protein n=1 Tax=Dactylosporangium sp. CA-233914 TaxID=3239934 RepID=UPI003D8C6649
MRRRGVLHIGVTGLAAMLVQACSEGSATAPSKGSAGSAGGSASPSVDPQAASTFDPSGYVPAAVPLAELKKLYNYDKGSSLNAQLTDKRSGDGVILEDITFSDTRGNDAIPAYVVSADIPGDTLRMPAVVFGTGPDGDRDKLLEEAMAVARMKALVMVTSLPIKPTGDPSADAKVLANAVVAQRRAFDLLIRRSDCDGSRVGYAGHHSGAALGAVLLGLETRITGAVLAAGPSRFSRWMVKQKVPQDWHPYLDSLARFDAGPYVAAGGKRSVLLQFGKQDNVVPEAERAELTTQVAGAKQRKDYDTGHDLAGFAVATADRTAFLKQVLRLS